VFHRLLSDEIWYFQTGGPVEVIQITATGELIRTVMGTEASADHQLQLLIPRGHYFAARPLAESLFSLVSCAVFPGFDFADFELTDKATLLAQYPQHTPWIEALGASRG
jgi:predicted cupin superfamily sugar epimerase